MVEELKDHFDCGEESFREKLRRKAGMASLIATGFLSLLHILSHVIPAFAVLGFSFGNQSSSFYRIISHEYMQIFYVLFVFLSFYYIYRDHKHHKHEKKLSQELVETKKKLRELENSKIS